MAMGRSFVKRNLRRCQVMAKANWGAMTSIVSGTCRKLISINGAVVVRCNGRKAPSLF